MTNKDLRTGMILEWSDGELSLVLLGTEHGDITTSETFEFKLTEFPNLFNFDNLDDTIIKVWQPRLPCYYFSGNELNTKNCKLIWERPKIHTISFDGGEPVEISDQSYQALKRSLKC